MAKPDWKAFGDAIMAYWPLHDVPADELQEWAVEHNILRAIPGGYNPEIHEDENGFEPDPGDPWYELNY